MHAYLSCFLLFCSFVFIKPFVAHFQQVTGEARAAQDNDLIRTDRVKTLQGKLAGSANREKSPSFAVQISHGPLPPSWPHCKFIFAPSAGCQLLATIIPSLLRWWEGLSAGKQCRYYEHCKGRACCRTYQLVLALLLMVSFSSLLNHLILTLNLFPKLF